MGSNTQVTQVIGRVLRQPNAKHYSDAKLNMANFYIKTDEKDVFKSILEDIRKTLSIDIPEITISYHAGKEGGKNRPTVAPLVGWPQSRGRDFISNRAQQSGDSSLDFQKRTE